MSNPARYALLASAISGQELQVEPAEPGAMAWTDGTTVFVDSEADTSTISVAVVVQAALVGAGSLDPDVVRALRRRPALVRRYLAIEGHRALMVHERLLPRPVRALLDADVAGRSASPAQSLALVTAGATGDDPPAAFGTIRPRHVREAGEGVNQGRGVDHAEGSPPDVPHVPHVPRRGAMTALRHLEDEDDAGPAADFSSPVGGGGGIGKFLRRLFGDTRSTGGGPPGADAPTHWLSHRPRGGRTVTISTRTAPSPDGADGVARVKGSGYRYPEWDSRRGVYRQHWCTVFEIEPPAAELAPFTVPATRAWRRPIGRLGMEFQRCHRQVDGDDLDVDASVEAQVELRAGIPPDDAIYVQSVRRRRDLAVLVLLDVSGSAAEPGAFGVRVHEHQRQAAGALVATLHELGDRVALYGFRSQGRGAVRVAPVKRFGDDLGEPVIKRLGGLVPSAYTRLGAAIRHGTAVLHEQAGTARRLLVVISDGLAYDHGYEPAYGEADSRRALLEARRTGIGCLCLSVGSNTDASALRRVFGTAAHAAVPRAAQLPSVVGPLFRAALGTAEAHRRVFVRRTRTSERLDIDRRIDGTTDRRTA